MAIQLWTAKNHPTAGLAEGLSTAPDRRRRQADALDHRPCSRLVEDELRLSG
jgi:hypothetical protein